MKRTSLLALLLLPPALGAIEPARAAAPRFTLQATAGMRLFSGDEFKRFYEGVQPCLGLALGYRLARAIEAFVAGEYLRADGELSHTREETRLRLVALEAGGRLLFSRGRLIPFFGGGSGYYAVREENVIGTLDKKRAGFFALAGMRWRLGRPLHAAVQAKYVFLKIEHSGKTIDLGGASLSVAVGLEF